MVQCKILRFFKFKFNFYWYINECLKSLEIVSFDENNLL